MDNPVRWNALTGKYEDMPTMTEEEEEELDAEVDALREKLSRIEQWCEAYPLDIFPEPDLKKAAFALNVYGISLDSVSAHAMRHVLTGIRKIIDQQE